MHQFTQAATPFSQVFNRMEKNLNYNHLQSKMLLPMLYNLQQTVMKQQMALKLCFAQGGQYNSLPVRGHPTFGVRQHETMQMNKGPFLFNSQRPRLMMKEKEPNEEISIKTESPVETSTSSGTLMDQYTVEHNFEGNSGIIGESEIKKGPQIMRRNGFKDQSNTQSSAQENDASKLPRKSNKLITPKRPPSNAKHLWINYGRKIIEFALQQTENETHIQIKRLVGKLSSKNDFKKVFESNQTDSEDEKAFKTLFGRLALFFIRFKAASAFEDSKYKQQMIAQRDFVASWIVQLTGL